MEAWVGWKTIAANIGIHYMAIIRNWKRWKLPIVILETPTGKKTPVLWKADFEIWKLAKLKATIGSDYQLYSSIEEE